MRLFNVREGFTADDDVLLPRFYENKSDRPMPGKMPVEEETELAKKYYYALMDWDARGIPLPETVATLGIE